MATLTVPQARHQLARLALTLSNADAPERTPENTINVVAHLIREIDALRADLAGEIGSDTQARTDLDQTLRGFRELAMLLMRQVNPDQAWFWTEDWQKKEREADEDIAAGRLIHYDNEEAFRASLIEERLDVANLR